jgi:hypothetical protein
MDAIDCTWSEVISRNRALNPKIERPGRDSNPGRKLRRLPGYPLPYRGWLKAHLLCLPYQQDVEQYNNCGREQSAILDTLPEKSMNWDLWMGPDDVKLLNHEPEPNRSHDG